MLAAPLRPRCHFASAKRNRKSSALPIWRHVRETYKPQVLQCQAGGLPPQAATNSIEQQDASMPAAASQALQEHDHSIMGITRASGRRRRSVKTPTAWGSLALSPGELRQRTGLSMRLCDHILAAQQRYKEIPRDTEVLRDRIQQLVRLLGAKTAAAALKSSPTILSKRPEVIALHLQSWLAFFSESSRSGATPHTPAVIRGRLLGQPNLLGPEVEKLVGNLYEMGILLQAQDLHAFAGKALKLALMQPATMQQKLRTLLAFLNAQQQQQHDWLQPVTTVSVVPGPFTYQQLQQAALKDHRWLMLSSDTLMKRLTNMQVALKVSREAVGKLFLRATSIAVKKPAVIERRILALKQLPGLPPDKAQAAILAFPALLNIRQEVIHDRWRQLKQAAGECQSWQQQLDQAAPSSIAALLAYSQAKYDRLFRLLELDKHEGTSLQRIMRLSEQSYAATFHRGRAPDA